MVFVDPYMTGQVLTWISPFYAPVWPSSSDMSGFSEPCLKGMEAEGHIRGTPFCFWLSGCFWIKYQIVDQGAKAAKRKPAVRYGGERKAQNDLAIRIKEDNMAENQFVSTVEALFKGMDQFVTTKDRSGRCCKGG